MAAFDQIVNSATKRQTRCSETNIPAKVHDGDGTDLSLICGKRWHVCLSESREIARRFLTKANNRPRSREAGSDPKSASHTSAYTPSDKPVQGNVGTKSRLTLELNRMRVFAEKQTGQRETPGASSHNRPSLCSCLRYSSVAIALTCRASPDAETLANENQPKTSLP